MIKEISKVLYITILTLCYITHGEAQAQIFFQFEQSGTLDVKRWTVGEKVMFRQRQFGDEWIFDRIIQIIPEDNALLFNDQIVHLDEITHIQYPRPVPNIIGKSLTVFGASWLVLGGTLHGLTELGLLESGFQFGQDTALIGVSTVATGFLMQKLWSKAIKKMNANKRVRIVDLRF